jgi:hypothetical protein
LPFSPELGKADDARRRRSELSKWALECFFGTAPHRNREQVSRRGVDVELRHTHIPIETRRVRAYVLWDAMGTPATRQEHRWSGDASADVR